MDTMYREHKKEQTRRALARAAAQLLLAQGLEAMTVAAVTKRANVSTRTFHNYFPRREDALVFFIQCAVDEFTDKVRRAPAGEAPLDLLQRLLAERIEAEGEPDTVLNLLTICENLGHTASREDRQRVRNVLNPLLDALHERTGGTLTRAGTALLLNSALFAGTVAVEEAQRPGSPDALTLLDEGFALLRSGFSV